MNIHRVNEYSVNLESEMSADEQDHQPEIDAYNAGIRHGRSSGMTSTELLAAGAALCHLASANARGPANPSRKDRLTMAELADKSYALLLSTGMTPTELKDLGLRLVEQGGKAISADNKYSVNLDGDSE